MSKTWFMTLLKVLSFSAFQAEACVVGVSGEDVLLPCLYNGHENLASLNISFEWRRGNDVVYTAAWTEGHEKRLNQKQEHSLINMTKPGDFTMKLSNISVSDTQNYSMHINFLDKGTSAVICTSCLTVAAHFTSPLLLQQPSMDEDVARFVCQSWGGFPKPSVLWLINFSQWPEVETVTTRVGTLPYSQLYNITSVLKANISLDSTVSCTIVNQLLNESLTTTFGVQLDPVMQHHSAFPWVFSLTLCMLVVMLVATALGFQIKWDQEARRARAGSAAVKRQLMKTASRCSGQRIQTLAKQK
ncbi:T-lymphocyte activation antigen CD80-like isoform X2 [Brachyhypopomus gauderio]|uniref:T-lymphocyte activation antigen CD80-like isoform X2 n=1 Tax=Brachyhypopomus gauderio TaxID=698409 RepID=UPI004042E9A4